MNKLKKILDYKYSKIVLATLAILLVTVPYLVMNKPKNKNKKIAKTEETKKFAHTDQDIIKEEEYQGLKFSNIALITDGGYTTFTADVTNTSDEESDIENVNIELKDANGNTVVTLLGNIGSPLKPNEMRTITATTKGELKNVKAKVISDYKS